MKKILCLVLLVCASTLAWSEEPVSDSVTPAAVAPTDDTVNPAVAAPTNETATSPVAVPTLLDIKIIEEKINDDNRDLNYHIQALYPQIKGSDITAAQTFNQLTTHLVQQYIDQFKKYLILDRPHMLTLPEDVRHNGLTIGYDLNVIKPNNQALMSLRLSIEGFQAGRAHPYHKHDVLNFNLSTDKTLTLEELFKPKSKYLQVMSNYCREKLGEKLEDKWMLDDGTKPLEKNFKNWNLDANGLLITFEEYQVAPYVNGPQEVIIPYAELKDVLDPSAPIYPCVANPKECAV